MITPGGLKIVFIKLLEYYFDLIKISNLSNRRFLRDFQWPSGYQIWHLITGSHLCRGLTPNGNVEDIAKYDPRLFNWP